MLTFLLPIKHYDQKKLKEEWIYLVCDSGEIESIIEVKGNNRQGKARRRSQDAVWSHFHSHTGSRQGRGRRAIGVEVRQQRTASGWTADRAGS